MNVEQLSIFLENKAGRLAEVTGALAAAGIDIKALSVADTAEFGILRMIVDNQEKSKAVLKDKGFTVVLTPVLAVEVPHRPGGLDGVLQILGREGVNVEYMYAFMHKGEKAVMIFRFDDTAAALKALAGNNIALLSPERIRG
jgi:hypothetical protein